MRLADFGFQNGINEVIGITQGEWINTAPLGLIVEDAEADKAKIRLYSNHTRKNLEREGVLWVNIVHDPIVFALASFEDLDAEWFSSLKPPILKNSLAWCRMEGEVKGAFALLQLKDGEVLQREVKAVNRGFNAVIEALVHATRYVSLKKPEMLEKVEYYIGIAEKCGGEREREAIEIIKKNVGLEI
ncbi:MAG: DUF447 family protein [Archaeoglobus sp.]|nr:DUF447 family protein [Archaeoglobus sp.]